MTPKRLRLVTIALLGAAFVVSSVGFSGSTPAGPHHGQAHASATR